jgi:hypothetical protein
MGMPDFDRTFPTLHMQDELRLEAKIYATAYSKVQEAFAKASFVPAFA